MSEDILIFIDIDCFNCGEKIYVPFRMNVQAAAYEYCNSCGEGVEISFSDNTLHISRLNPLAEK